MAQIIYNVTVKVEESTEKEWLQWMKKEHIPDVLRTGCFSNCKIMRLRYPKDDEGLTYAFQYTCDSMGTLDDYLKNHAVALQQDHSKRFGNNVAAFRTILEEIQELEPAH